MDLTEGQVVEKVAVIVGDSTAECIGPAVIQAKHGELLGTIVARCLCQDPSARSRQ